MLMWHWLGAHETDRHDIITQQTFPKKTPTKEFFLIRIHVYLMTVLSAMR